MKKRDIEKTKDEFFDFANGGKKEIVEHYVDGKKVVIKKYKELKENIDKKRLNPIFEENLETYKSEHFPSIIMIEESNKKHMESEVCEGSIGYREDAKGEEVLVLYLKDAKKTEIDFKPDLENTVYFRDPYNERIYISLDEYFEYIKKARVTELEEIALKLGAKRTKITIKERKAQLVKRQQKVEIKKKIIVNGDAETNSEKKEYSNIEVISEANFNGSDTPIEPELTYFEGNNDIAFLIKTRMDPDGRNRIKTKTYSCTYLGKREMQIGTAVKIDCFLKRLKLAGDASVASQVQTETRTSLEYEIEF